MYRQSALLPGGGGGGSFTKTSLLPSPDNTSDDSELDIVEALDRKRRQLDEEVARFKAAKEKEFVDFERDLRAKKQKRRTRDEAIKSRDKKTTSTPATQNTSTKPESHAVGALSLLAGNNKTTSLANGSVTKTKKESKKTDKSVDKARPPLSKPTLSLNKSNITGETAPQPADDGTPPTSSDRLSKSLSRSPGDTSGPPFTPPKARQQNKVISPVTPTREKSDSFPGLFAPAYLPLLESKPASQPTSPQAQIKVEVPRRSGSFSAGQEPSNSSGSLTSPLRAQRALTAPILSTINLPSALRTASGTAIRKPKHVTFQLANQAIVEPSSSYEELPSPEPVERTEQEVGLGVSRGIDEVIDSNDGETSGIVERELEVEEDFDIEESTFGRRPLRSPTIKSQERKGSSDSTRSENLSDTIPEAADGGSGVGFFELDEELSSPLAGEVRPFKLDGDSSDDSEDDAKDSDGENRKRKSRVDGENNENDDLKTKYEYSGSVPIDIVRPSGSWVGSFGH